MTPDGPGTAPAFRLPGLHGGDVEGPAPGVHTLILFTKSSCPTCRWAAPYFRTLAENAPEGLQVLGIAQDDEEAEREFAREAGLEYPIGLEASPWETSAAYGLVTVPTAVLVAPDGAVLNISEGFSRDDLNEAVRQASGGSATPPLPDDVPSFRPG